MPVWKRTELLIVVAATFMVAAITLVFYQTWQAARIDRIEEFHSRAVLESVNTLARSVKDAETVQRDYLLTKNSKYLAEYQSASHAISAESNRLKKMLPRNADTVRFFEVIEAKMAELSQPIEMRNRSTEALQSTQQKITTQLYRDLADNSARRRERSARFAYVNIGGGVFLLCLLIISATLIHRSVRRREQLISLLREDEKSLRDLSRHAQDAENRMRDILESIADGFVSVDRNFAVTYINSAAERIFGRPKDELMGRNFWTEFPDATAETDSRYRQVMESATPSTFERFLPQRNAWWEESIYPSKEGGLSIYLRDVTERKRLEERGRHAQKLESLGVLAGGIAHDFNNLLTAVLGGASLLQEELRDDSAAAGHVKIILNASERAAQLTRQMLAYSGRGRFVVEPLDLSQQVREITQLLESSVPRDIELTLNLDDRGVLVEADAGQIQQLVMNLVINAAEAIEKGNGAVVVSTRVEDLDAEYIQDNMAGDSVVPGRFMLLQVHDNGKGMDEATLAKIFDPFFTTKFTGRGLGLAAVIGIVRGHRGAIKVYSHPGQGTTFKVFLPAVREQARTPSVSVVEVGSLRGHETVLVVDDEESVQQMARLALEQYGYQVLQARNGREALQIYEPNGDSISLVLLDMTMPVMSGEETLQRLKQMDPDVLVIVSSGYNEIEALRRFGKGVFGFLQKPYRAATLAQKVRSALNGRQSAVT